MVERVGLLSCGLLMGSFVNCVVYRLNNGGNPLKGRSFCPKCKKLLAWFDNIPLLSFILLKGKCRKCKKKISWQYPLVEIAVSLGWLILGSWVLKQGWSLGQVGIWLLFWTNLAAILISDLVYMTIPDELVLVGLFLGSWSLPPAGVLWWSRVAAMISGSVFFFFLHWVTKGKGMGLGDVKLALPLGLFLGGKRVLLAYYIAFLLGAMVGGGMVLAGKKKIKSLISFGPFMIAGAMVSYWWGDWIISQYQKLLI